MKPPQIFKSEDFKEWVDEQEHNEDGRFPIYEVDWHEAESRANQAQAIFENWYRQNIYVSRTNEAEPEWRRLCDEDDQC